MTLIPSLSISVGRHSQRVFRGAASLLLAAGLVLAGGMTPASAQVSPSPNVEEMSVQWRAHFDEQAAQELRQKPSLRTDLLQIVIDQAAGHEQLDLPKTAGALLHVIENDSHRRHRLMAVQALGIIGAEHAGEAQYQEVMNRLYALMKEEPSDRLRGVAADAIDQFQSG